VLSGDSRPMSSFLRRAPQARKKRMVISSGDPAFGNSKVGQITHPQSASPLILKPIFLASQMQRSLTPRC
jgi:hypothetical protein